MSSTYRFLLSGFYNIDQLHRLVTEQLLLVVGGDCLVSVGPLLADDDCLVSQTPLLDLAGHFVSEGPLLVDDDCLVSQMPLLVCQFVSDRILVHPLNQY